MRLGACFKLGMAPATSDSLEAESLKPLLARIDLMLAQIAAGDERIGDLLAQVKRLTARIAELEAKLGQPRKTPDNSGRFTSATST